MAEELLSICLVVVVAVVFIRPQHGADAAEGHEVALREPEPGRVRPLRQAAGTTTRHTVLPTATHIATQYNTLLIIAT